MIEVSVMGLFKKKAVKKTAFAQRKPRSHPVWGVIAIAFSLLLLFRRLGWLGGRP